MDPASADLAQEMQLRDLGLLNDDDGFADEEVSNDTRIAYGLFKLRSPPMVPHSQTTIWQIKSVLKTIPTLL